MIRAMRSRADNTAIAISIKWNGSSPLLFRFKNPKLSRKE